MENKIINNVELQQVELYIEDKMVGRVEYFDDPELLTLSMVFVEPDMRGKGIASKLGKVAYDFAMENGKPLNVTCDVLKSILTGNDSYKDLNWNNK